MVVKRELLVRNVCSTLSEVGVEKIECAVPQRRGRLIGAAKDKYGDAYSVAPAVIAGEVETDAKPFV